MHLSYFILIFQTCFYSLSTAVVSSISAPAIIKPGDGFNIYITNSNYIQSVYDVALAVGIAPGNGLPGALVQVTDTYYVGPGQYFPLGSVPKWTSIPSSTPKGKATISVTVFSLYGVVYYPVLKTFNVTITVGDTTSANYVTST
ncbi:hypothetical protein H072_5146 [Dactylellina haptotyla CBS 200.50]|uniref:Uncharacterized protein n=1 Tax=Dactylellina haptotyla (strain CBS 200.50) TaxID=1284197 RepID=S8BND6_DACHA|nr:hypothetical protein H072_5146 [Dactylellina haptotyla CBS 200.50]